MKKILLLIAIAAAVMAGCSTTEKRRIASGSHLKRWPCPDYGTNHAIVARVCYKD